MNHALGLAARVPLRVWVHRAYLDSMLTRQLQRVKGCAGCRVIVGHVTRINDFGECNWWKYSVTSAPGSLEEWKVRAIAGTCVSGARELYNVIEDPQ